MSNTDDKPDKKEVSRKKKTGTIEITEVTYDDGTVVTTQMICTNPYGCD